MNKALIIIPTYNEIENIEAIIAAVLEQNDDFDVLIISARREVNIFELKIQQQLSDVSEL